MNKRILLVGANGKMGRAVRETLQSDYFIVGFDKNDSFSNFKQNQVFDLVIDFGSAESSLLSAEFASKNGIPLIIGSTGQSQHQLVEIYELCKNIPLLICANFSVGIAILKNAICEILKASPTDICIFEKHHREKKDSPSGTAIALKNYILSHIKMANESYNLQKNSETTETNFNLQNEIKTDAIQMLSLRGGKEFGTHKVSFYFENELIELSHTAFSRNAFADGVKLAVNFMLSRAKSEIYSFDEILQNLINS